MLFLSCYRLIKNNCTGSCQGCSDCPVCCLYHDGVTNKKFRNATRWEMIKYALSSKWESIKTAVWFKMNDKKVKEIMKKSVKEMEQNK